MTPLILLVGFLGAGKTTYLRHLLPQIRAQGLDPHVIINDYQNARVDAELLQDLSDSVTAISGSCVCCGSRDELLGALEAFKHSPGRVVVIETNGTTDSEELIEMLALEPGLDRFTQPIQISIIDAKRWQKRFWHNSLELEQARTASYVFVSRLDEVDDKRRADVEGSFHRLEIAAAPASPEKFTKELVTISAQVRDLPNRSMVMHEADCACGHHHEHEHHHHDDKPRDHAVSHFSSLQIELPATVARADVAAFLAGLPPEVLRVKGLARLAESPAEYHVFQQVEGGSVQWLPIGKTTRLAHPLAILIGPGIETARVVAQAARIFGSVTARADS